MPSASLDDCARPSDDGDIRHRDGAEFEKLGDHHGSSRAIVVGVVPQRPGIGLLEQAGGGVDDLIGTQKCRTSISIRRYALSSGSGQALEHIGTNPRLGKWPATFFHFPKYSGGRVAVACRETGQMTGG